MDHGHIGRAQSCDQEVRVHLGLDSIVGVDPEKVGPAPLGQALLRGGGGDDDEIHALVEIHGRQSLAAVEVTDHADHPIPGALRSADGVHLAHGHIAVRLVVQGPHVDTVAQQSASPVDLLRGQACPAQHRLPAIGLEAGEGDGHVDGHVTFCGGTAATSAPGQ